MTNAMGVGAADNAPLEGDAPYTGNFVVDLDDDEDDTEEDDAA
ncbi:hypothetical protein P0F65_13525 [Sphingomonas sp. I4]